MGLGSDLAQRLHGLPVLRYLGADQVSCGGVVQAAHRGGGRVLQRAGARGGCRPRQPQDPDAGKCAHKSFFAHGSFVRFSQTRESLRQCSAYEMVHSNFSAELKVCL